jgi:hypothetical protein
MSEVENPQTGPVAECMMCHCGSNDRPLIPLVHHGQEQWVCVGCLPMLIHGAH